MMLDDDPVLRRVRRLTVLSSDEQRAGRLRARCRARLARRAPRPSRQFGPAVLTGFCLLYLSAIVHDMLQLRNLL